MALVLSFVVLKYAPAHDSVLAGMIVTAVLIHFGITAGIDCNMGAMASEWVVRLDQAARYGRRFWAVTLPIEPFWESYSHDSVELLARACAADVRVPP